MTRRLRVYRVTVDTNVFLRSLLSPSGVSARVIDTWRRGDYVLLASKPIVQEIGEVLMRPELMALGSYSEADVVALIKLVGKTAVIIDPSVSFEYCRDPDDDKFVTCAIVGRAQFLVSGDNDLIGDDDLRETLRQFGVTLLPPREFVAEMDRAIGE